MISRALIFADKKGSYLLKSLWLITIFITLTGGSIGAEPINSSKDYSFSNTGHAAQFPFDLYLNLIFIKAQINSSTPLWFILDSGFEGTVINSSIAENLGLNITNEHQENAPGGEIDVAYVDSVNFLFPGIIVSNQRVMAIPLNPLEPIIGRYIDGILGHDYFNRFVIEIDYAKKIITLTDPEAFTYSGKGVALPVEIENDESFLYAFLKTRDHPQVKARLKIDTGSADVLGLNGSFVSAENLFGPSIKKVLVPGAAVGGYTRNYVARLKSLRIGKIDIKNSVIGFSEDTTRVGDAGTIGGELFRRFKVTFDYSRHTLYLEKNKSFSEPYEYDMSGIFPVALGPDFKTIKVQYISDDSPAAEAGIRPNDRILKIDDKPSTEFTIADIRQMFKIDGKTYRLEILRDGKTIEVEIKMRKLI